SGDFRHSFVLNQPYTIQDIETGLKVKSEWQALLAQHYRAHYGESGMGKIILYGRDTVSLVSDSDMPTRRGLAAAPVEDILLFDNRSKNHYNAAIQVNLSFPHISLVNRTVSNSELKDDPRYFGDTGEWIQGRINAAYLNVNSGPFDFFLGRMDRNWGALSSPGLILSDNPYSYDQAQFSYTASRIMFSMIVSRLEDLDAVVVENPDSTFEARKFMTAHRVDFSFSNKFQVGLTEVAVYGGPDRDFEFGFLNPMNYFYVVQRNNNQQVNGIWALDLFYKPKPKLNLFLQFLVDDFIINNSEEGDDRENFPDRMGITLKLTEADNFMQGLQTGIEYTRIGNRTYQSRRTYENFQYRGKSLGYPISSTERVAVTAKYFNLYPLMLNLTGEFRRIGDVDVTHVFPLKKEDFPVGIVEKRWSVELKARYFLNYWSRLTVTLGYERFENFNNVEGDNRKNLKLILSAHLNLAVSHRFR
ncbi:MAG: hypothetical protein O7G31_16015, partial [Calditrichaeota bacterium]|nr:hypothetical protein [Calditrichota bacterium]